MKGLPVQGRPLLLEILADEVLPKRQATHLARVDFPGRQLAVVVDRLHSYFE